MKHLFRLALKYVTRQKLRTMLMFLSVTLAVFVLNTFLVYTSSLIRSMRNNAIIENGEWEIEMSDVLYACSGGLSDTVTSEREAAEIISKHVAVDKSLTSLTDMYQFSSFVDEQGRVGFFNLELDNGTKQRTSSVMQSSLTGDVDIWRTSWMYEYDTNGLAPDEAIVPEWMHDAGYEIGDTFTVTVTPEMGLLDEDSEPVKAARRALAELNEASEKNYYIIEGEEIDQEARNGRNVKKWNMLTLIKEYSDINELELKDNVKGEPITITAKIAGFDSQKHIDGSVLSLATALVSDVDITPLFGSVGDFSRSTSTNCYVLTNPNTSFEYNMELLLKDLGFDDDAFDDFRYGMNGYEVKFNTEYLLTSFRSIDGIAMAVPYIGAYLVILAVVWLFARFIIDNAFEISVQERSVQFAALRIMGASKTQLATLVFTEGLFYTLTALPLGTVVSILACKYVFDSLRSIGMDLFEFYASPLTIVICVALCLAGIFISTYTSAMWAARKLTPAEALNYGKPKSKRAAKKKQRRSKLNLGSKRFMIRYTMKNILRTKRRFLISSVAMALGVLMFTICLQLGMTFFGGIWEELKNEQHYDFYIFTDAGEVQDMQAELMASGEFANSKFNCHGSVWCEESEINKLGDLKNAIEINGNSDGVPINIYAMDKGDFESVAKEFGDLNIPEGEREAASISQLLGMSYEEFEKSQAVLLLPQQHWGELDDFGYGYSPISDLGFDDKLVFNGNNGESIGISGIAHAGYATEILMPINCAQELINNGSYMSGNLYLTVKDAEHYPAAKETVDKLDLPYDFVYDEYRVGTGLVTLVKTIVMIILIFMLSIWLCGIVSMMNTINTSALNRSKELLMMRAVGMTRRQLTGTVVLESLLFSAISAIVGTLVSVAGYQLIMRLIFNYDDPQSSIVALVVSVIANVVIAFLAALPGIRTLNHSVSK